MSEIRERHPEKIARIIVFGSYVRGDFDAQKNYSCLKNVISEGIAV